MHCTCPSTDYFMLIYGAVVFSSEMSSRHQTSHVLCDAAYDAYVNLKSSQSFKRFIGVEIK